MVQQIVLKKLFAAFPYGIINHLLEFVADPNHRVNSYFRLEDCETEEDVAAKLLKWVSRDAYKSQHFTPEWRNKQVHEYHLNGINQFCGTSFGEDDIELIYSELGNRCNHELTLKFIRSGYDTEVLIKEVQKWQKQS